MNNRIPKTVCSVYTKFTIGVEECIQNRKTLHLYTVNTILYIIIVIITWFAARC